jgi:hypothetical protein
MTFLLMASRPKKVKNRSASMPSARAPLAMISAGEDHFRPSAEQAVKLVFGHRVQLGAGDYLHPAGADADAAAYGE